ncbi:MAG: amidohydrolase family protein [Actinomycetota bacterium]
MLRDLPLREFRPEAALSAKATVVERCRFPAVDAHNHLGRWLTGRWAARDVGALLSRMDQVNVAAIVNLDGMWARELEANLDRYDRAHPGRFATFAQLDWSELEAGSGFGERLAAGVGESAARGARGLKVWKNLGLHLRDGRGKLLMPDDPRLAPVWAACAGAQIPVLIHTADPVAFFQPLTARNERLEELLENPDWWFGNRRRFPRFERLMERFERLIAANPDTTFIGAHVAGNAEDLSWVSRMLKTYPNLHADIGARLAELGRQPRAVAALFKQHPRRILLGTDQFPPSARTYQVYARFLETADEHFPYSTGEPPVQGRWAVSGLGLPDTVLRRVYRDNAVRLIPGLRA